MSDMTELHQNQDLADRIVDADEANPHASNTAAYWAYAGYLRNAGEDDAAEAYADDSVEELVAQAMAYAEAEAEAYAFEVEGL